MNRRAYRVARTHAPAFTLLEVMIAIAVLGITMLSLLALHHQDLQNVIRTDEMSHAMMLAQTVMSAAELQRIPLVGVTNGDFDSLYPGQFPGYRWQRTVQGSSLFPDLIQVSVRISYGPNFSRSYDILEVLHNPAFAQQQAR